MNAPENEAVKQLSDDCHDIAEKLEWTTQASPYLHSITTSVAKELRRGLKRNESHQSLLLLSGRGGAGLRTSVNNLTHRALCAKPSADGTPTGVLFVAPSAYPEEYLEFHFPRDPRETSVSDVIERVAEQLRDGQAEGFEAKVRTERYQITQ